MNAELQKEVQFLSGVGPKRAEVLRSELGIRTVEDLLNHLPFRYEDRTQFQKTTALARYDGSAQLVGRLSQIQMHRKGKRNLLFARLQDDKGIVSLSWWNQTRWIVKHLKEGERYVVYGPPTLYKGRVSLVHPEMRLLAEDEQPLGCLVPVYHSTQPMKRRGLDSGGLGQVIKEVLEELPDQPTTWPEVLPEPLVKKYRFLSRDESMRQIHRPQTMGQLKEARRRLKFDEIFLLQVSLLSLRKFRKERLEAHVLGVNDFVNKFVKTVLPFSLTQAQRRVLREIYKDLKSAQQMHRLLQGDVASGKTVVAFISLLTAIGTQKQAAIMAPTEVLAEQHFQTCQAWTEALGLKVALLTGSTKTKKRQALLASVSTGDTQLIIGTHALLEDPLMFKDLALVVIDEQHRFGVWQRARLWQKGKTKNPHVLLMTATPIPRTLAMTLYGDVDVSVIDELPAGRPTIRTLHRQEKARAKLQDFVLAELQKGRQAYWVYPLIEESEKMDLNYLKEGFAQAQQRFPRLKIAMLHGRMRSAEKTTIMDDFHAGRTQLLVSTTVIEVGIDVPNATLMIIEHADRFGLAQLHQLRGRIGRGKYDSYCVLLTSTALSKEAQARIHAMTQHLNGFEIANIDLELRGPGNRLGTQQSGAPELCLVDLGKDTHLIMSARQEAQDILRSDPSLDQPQHQALQSYVQHLQEQASWKYIA